MSGYCQDKGHDVVAVDQWGGAREASELFGGKDVRDHNILEGPIENEKSFDFGMDSRVGIPTRLKKWDVSSESLVSEFDRLRQRL